jgi:hypothetical protein
MDSPSPGTGQQTMPNDQTTIPDADRDADYHRSTGYLNLTNAELKAWLRSPPREGHPDHEAAMKRAAANKIEGLQQSVMGWLDTVRNV